MSNQISITGAMGRAPALNFTSAGKAAWGFSLAYTPSRKTDNGWEDTGPTLWFDVTVWGDDGEDLARRYEGVEKGRATVVGRLASRSWKQQDGTEVTQMTIMADAVTIHPSRERRTQPAQQSSAGQGDPWAPAGHGGTFPASSQGDEPPFAA